MFSIRFLIVSAALFIAIVMLFWDIDPWFLHLLWKYLMHKFCCSSNYKIQFFFPHLGPKFLLSNKKNHILVHFFCYNFLKKQRNPYIFAYVLFFMSVEYLNSIQYGAIKTFLPPEIFLDRKVLGRFGSLRVLGHFRL